MAKTKISEYSATANSNTDVASINIDEGCAPSGINNAIRAVMGHLKDFQQGTNGDPFNGPVNGTLGATTAATANVTTLTTSSTVTHNGGTAYGVGYLNASKVLTTGSALTFDGTNLGLGVTPSGWNASSKAFQIGASGNVFLENYNGVTYILGYNAYRSVASGYLYTTTGYSASLFGSGSTGGFQWNIAPSGTAGNAITFTQAMTLDASGNLGLRVTPNASWDGTFPALQIGLGTVLYNNTSANGTFLGSNFYWNGANNIYLNNANATAYGQTAGAHQWFTAGIGTGIVNFTQAMTLDASGNLLVGKTSAGSLTTNGGELDADGTLIAVRNTAAGFVGYVTNNNASGSGLFEFRRQSTVVGSITYNGSLTLFNQTSDQRLKENIVNAGTALSILNQIKIRSFDWIESKTHETHGVVAQELKEIAPQCVTEGIDHEDGSIDRPWQIDTSPLVPMLIKAIQEQQALITQLTARITALEGA